MAPFGHTIRKPPRKLGGLRSGIGGLMMAGFY